MVQTHQRVLIVLCLLLMLFAVNANAQKPELIVQTGHSGSVSSVTFSSDGKFLASGSDDGTVKLWDVASGKELRTLMAHSHGVYSVAFSPDGKILASGGLPDGVKIWDVASGAQLRDIRIYSYAWSVAFSPDGKLLACGSGSGGDDGAVKLWDVASGKEVRSLSGFSGRVYSVAFSPDSKLLASGGTGQTIKLWDVASGKEVRTLIGHTSELSSLAFTPDGKVLMSRGGWDKSIRLWEVESGKQLLKLMVRGDFLAVALSPDGKLLASGNDDGGINLWDVASGKQLRTVAESADRIRSLAFSPDGEMLASGDWKYSVQLWDIVNNKNVFNFASHSNPGYTAVFNPDSKLLAIRGNKTIKLWDVTSGKELRTLGDNSEEFHSIGFSFDGKLLASRSHKIIKIWDVASGKELRAIADNAYSVAFSPDGKTLATWGDKGTIKLWDVASGKALRVIAGYEGLVTFSPDGKLLAVGASKVIKLWDVASGKELRSLTGSMEVGTIAFSPDSKLLAYGGDTIKLWNVESGIQLLNLAEQSRSYLVAFSPDGKTLASASGNGAIRLWDVASGKELRSLMGSGYISFSSDSRLLATGGIDRTIKLWDVASGKYLLALIPIGKTDWVVIDSNGRFDASPNAQKLMHWRAGNDIIELDQLKERYYEPGLLQKILGYNKESLREVETFGSVKLPPRVTWTTPAADSTKMTISLNNQGGGIGKVQVLVNSKEAIADARPTRFSPDTQQATFIVDIKDSAFIPGKENRVEVITWNYDAASKKGYVSSPRGPYVSWTPQGKTNNETPELYAIIGGISDYAGSQIDLLYAAKDAEEFANALELGATNLLGKERVHIKLLTTGSTDAGTIAPTKENFRKAFEEFRKAKPTDILLIYLSGHGVTLQQGNDLYLYLTEEARSTDAATLSDEKVRESVTISSEELVRWLTTIKALKQVMVLDTCAAGAAATSLMAKRDLPSDQIRALDRLKDRTGFFVLMGSAADAVSYEASRYGQGLLTYTLLQAMKGARLREGVYADVNQLFDYAADTVPQMARNIGGIQRPVTITPQTGSSFDIGRFTSEVKEKIKLSQMKPLILRPRLQNKELDYDNLKLEIQLRQALRDASYVTGRGQSEAPLVYVDADEMSDATTPSGSYVVEGDKVKITIRLIRNDEPVATVTVEGTKNDKEGLVKQIVQSITKSSSGEAEPRKSN